MVILFISTPSKGSAIDSVARTRATETAGGMRRFSVTLAPATIGPDSEQESLLGTLDIDGTARMVCSMRLRDGACLVLGRDGDEMWEIRRMDLRWQPRGNGRPEPRGPKGRNHLGPPPPRSAGRLHDAPPDPSATKSWRSSSG